MKKLEKNELLEINGGETLTAAFLSSLSKGVTTLLDLGRTLGSSIRRAISNNVCQF